MREQSPSDPEFEELLRKSQEAAAAGNGKAVGELAIAMLGWRLRRSAWLGSALVGLVLFQATLGKCAGTKGKCGTDPNSVLSPKIEMMTE